MLSVALSLGDLGVSTHLKPLRGNWVAGSSPAMTRILWAVGAYMFSLKPAGTRQSHFLVAELKVATLGAVQATFGVSALGFESSVIGTSFVGALPSPHLPVDLS